MEIHKYICDHCKKELGDNKWTISQNYTASCRDIDGDTYYEKIKNEYHICPDCWSKFEKLILNK